MAIKVERVWSIVDVTLFTLCDVLLRSENNLVDTSSFKECKVIMIVKLMIINKNYAI